MRVLLVSIAFPPKSDPESLQAGKYAKYLSKEVTLDVATSASPTLWMPLDEKLLPYAEVVDQTISIPITEPKYRSIFLNKFFRRYLKPDTRASFHALSGRITNELKEQPDIIYTRGFPLSSVIAGYKLKKELNLPWMLHMSDPWVESPLFDYDKSSYHRKMEETCFRTADLVSFTSKKVTELYSKKYPDLAEKFRFFPNTFDDDHVEEPTTVSNDIFTLVYTGSLNGTRSLKDIIAACKLLIAEGVQVRIEVAGAADTKNYDVLTANKDILTFHGLLSNPEARALQRRADLLIAVDFNFTEPGQGVYFPSKLLDYMITRKPILGLTNQGSTTEEVLKDIKQEVCYHGEVERLKVTLGKLISGEVKTDYEIPAVYSSSYNAKRLVQEFKSLCEK